MDPRILSDELLNALPFLIMEIGDRFTGFVLEFGEQSGDVFYGVPVMLGPGERCGKRVNEVIQTREQAVDEFVGHLGLSQHFLQPRIESSIHDGLPCVTHP